MSLRTDAFFFASGKISSEPHRARPLARHGEAESLLAPPPARTTLLRRHKPRRGSPPPTRAPTPTTSAHQPPGIKGEAKLEARRSECPSRRPGSREGLPARVNTVKLLRVNNPVQRLTLACPKAVSPNTLVRDPC